MLATAPGCELDVQRGPDWLLVRVRNLDLTDSDVPSLAERIWRVLQQHFTYRLVLELDEVPAMEPDLMEQLFQLHQQIEKHEGVMRLCGLSPENRRALQAYCPNEQFPPYEDRQEALLGRKPR
jgi:anti-anti-sigma regulatory factor